MTTQEIAAGLLWLFGPDGDRWIQGALASDSYGRPVSPHDVSAKCWCVQGGACRLLGVSSGFLLIDPGWTTFRAALLRHIGRPGVTTWNDAPTTTWDDVKAALEALAEQT